MPRFTVRDFGTCLKLNGSGNTNTLTASAPAQSNFFTMALWIKPTTQSFESLMTFNQTSGADLVFQGNGTLRMSSLGSGGWAISINVIQVGVWQHVIFTRNSSNIWTYYYNGIAAGSGTNSNGVGQSAGLLFGQEAGAGANYTGLMDEGMYWNTSISSAEALALYTNGTIPQAASLQIYYKWDEGSGTTTADKSGNNNTGTLNGAGATWSTDVVCKLRTTAGNRFLVRDFGTCFYIAANNSQAATSNSSTLNAGLNGDMTCCFWFKTVVATSGLRVLGRYQNNSWDFELAGGGKFMNFNFFGGLAHTGTIFVGDNQWHHIAVSRVNSTGVINMYVDGVFDSTFTDAYAITLTNGTLTLGDGSGAAALLAKVDDVQIYKQALNLSQIKLIYYTGIPYTSNQLLWWKMDEGSGSTLLDSFGNGWTAAITNGGTYSTDVFMIPRTLAGTRTAVT